MKDIRYLILNAMIAAVYAALTLGFAPFSYGPVQIRISEFMTLFAFTNRKCVPGLVVGCFIANIGSPLGVTDMMVGTFATFLAVYGMRFVPNIYAASMLPVISNGVIITLELAYLGIIPSELPVIASTMAYIGLGEFLSVSILGIAVVKLLLKNSNLREYLFCCRA